MLRVNAGLASCAIMRAMPTAHRERQSLELERQELLPRLAAYQAELDGLPTERRERREWLDWQIRRAQKRIGVPGGPARVNVRRPVEYRLGGAAMSYNVLESLVRERLRARRGQVYCAICLAKDLQQDPERIKAAMEELALRQTFWAGACPCGGTGLVYRP